MDPKFKQDVIAMQARLKPLGFDLETLHIMVKSASAQLKAARRNHPDAPQKIRAARVTFYALSGLARQLLQNGGY